MFSYLTVELVSRVIVFTLVWNISDKWLFFNVYQGKVCLKFVVKCFSYALEKMNKLQCYVSRTMCVFIQIFTWPTLQGWSPSSFFVLKFPILKIGVTALIWYPQILLLSINNCSCNLLQRLGFFRNGNRRVWEKNA